MKQRGGYKDSDCCNCGSDGYGFSCVMETEERNNGIFDSSCAAISNWRSALEYKELGMIFLSASRAISGFCENLVSIADLPRRD